MFSKVIASLKLLYTHVKWRLSSTGLNIKQDIIVSPTHIFKWLTTYEGVIFHILLTEHVFFHLLFPVISFNRPMNKNKIICPPPVHI